MSEQCVWLDGKDAHPPERDKEIDRHTEEERKISTQKRETERGRKGESQKEEGGREGAIRPRVPKFWLQCFSHEKPTITYMLTANYLAY